MKIINGIKFHKDYDEFNLTENHVDRMMLKLTHYINIDKYYKLWEDLGKENKESKKLVENKSIEYFLGLAEPDSKEDETNIDRLLKVLKAYTSSLEFRHSGDCTNHAFGCARCVCDKMLDIDTTFAIDNFIERLESVIFNYNYDKKHNKPDLDLSDINNFLMKNKEKCVEIYNYYRISNDFEDLNIIDNNDIKLVNIKYNNEHKYETIVYEYEYKSGFKDDNELFIEEFKELLFELNSKKRKEKLEKEKELK